MTLTFLVVIIIVISSYFGYKWIHKYRYPLYIINLAIAIPIAEESANYVTFGFIALAFFIVVMFTGALDQGRLRKRLLAVRAELAIIGTVYLIPHFLAFTNLVLEDLGLFHATLNFYLGLVAGAILFPLTISSFTYIRKQMGFKAWKAFHKLAYFGYLAIAVHLIVQNTVRVWIYVGLFGLYLVTRWMTWQQTNRVRKQRIADANNRVLPTG